MIKLRPHHLLCTRAFRGKGYNDEFVLNMTTICNKLHSEAMFSLVESNDDICRACPHMIQDQSCKNENQVQKLDKSVMHILKLEPGNYSVHKINQLIKHTICRDSFDNICKDCSWYKYDICFMAIQESLQ